MITRIQALNFRSLRYVDQSLTGFQALVGPNGSGKSSFLDVVSFISDVIRIGVEKATSGDAASAVASRVSDPRDLTWMRSGGQIQLAIEMQIPDRFRTGPYQSVRYELGLQVTKLPSPLEISYEALHLFDASNHTDAHPPLSLFPNAESPPDSIFGPKAKGWKNPISKSAGGKDYFRSESGSFRTQFNLGKYNSALAGLPSDESRFPISMWAREFLSSAIQRIQLDAEAMRKASPPGQTSAYRPNGSNLPWVIDAFKKKGEPGRFSMWVEHLADAVPGVKDVHVIVREDDRYAYLVVEFENGLVAPSWVLSDGTLRIIALTLLAYLGLEGATLLIEEPENGVHPSAIQSVVDGLRQVTDGQVIMASHSPVVLGTLNPQDVLCFAKDDSGATAIVRGENHPVLKEWRNRPDLGELLISGVLG